MRSEFKQSPKENPTAFPMSDDLTQTDTNAICSRSPYKLTSRISSIPPMGAILQGSMKHENQAVTSGATKY